MSLFGHDREKCIMYIQVLKHPDKMLNNLKRKTHRPNEFVKQFTKQRYNRQRQSTAPQLKTTNLR